MSTYIQTENVPTLVTRVRRVSKSGFLYESNSKSPRLDKMIAHINIYDQTTRQIEEDLVREHEQSLAQKKLSRTSSRPQLGSRTSEYGHKAKEVPAWVTELTSRPASEDCVVVSEAEVEEIECMDDEDSE